jgi:serine hydrolase
MKIAEADILLVPGLGNSGPGHWQRRWLEKMPTAQWVEQEEWDEPLFEPWIETLQRAIQMATRPVVLVGHSLGATVIVHSAQRLKDTKVKGAFLVCPPDLDENTDVQPAALPFANVPRDPLPFPSLLIASQNDVFCSIERAGDLANAWGSEFHDAGEVGHLNLASGHGPWPEGLMMFTRLMQRLHD